MVKIDNFLLYMGLSIFLLCLLLTFIFFTPKQLNEKENLVLVEDLTLEEMKNLSLNLIEEGDLILTKPKSFSDDYAVFIEYGLQTVHDKTLKLINRNHSFVDFKAALNLVKGTEIKPAVHVILGLPGETKQDMLDTARILSKMPLWGIKFHCLHVVGDTVLEKQYKENKINLLTEDEYIDILSDFLKIIPDDWVVLRLVSDAGRDKLIAPFWVNDKQRVLNRLKEKLGC